jgi:hypothetical protein
MSDRHVEIARRLADATNMIHSARLGNTSLVDVTELRNLLCELEKELVTMQPQGTPTIDADKLRASVAEMIRGLSVGSWDAVDPEAYDAMDVFLNGMRIVDLHNWSD